MLTKVQRWGNSLGVRIPRTMARELKLEHGTQVELIEEPDRIIIQRMKGPQLKELLDGISAENVHGEVELEGPIGRESW